MPLSKPTILVVEDETAIRQMLRFALEHAGMRVIEAAHVKMARRYLQETALPDLILLDWMLPSISGIDFAKELKRHRHTQNIPIILLTAKALEDDKVTGLEAGADDYMVKPFSPRELLARINAVLRRGPIKQPDGTIHVGELLVNVDAQRASFAGQEIKLGPLEYRLLAFFVTHQDRAYTRDDLLSLVWGVSAYLDQRTVDVHIRRLRKVLKPYGLDGMVQTIHGLGYRFSVKQDKPL